MVAAGRARAGVAGLAGGARRRRPARLVAGDRRRLAGGGEKGGAKVARTLRGRPGSSYQLAVDANGAPLAVRLSAGNENEQRHLLPLVDELAARDPTRRAVGRPRLRLPGDRAGPARARDRTADQQTTQKGGADPGRHTRPRSLARQKTTAQNTRPASASALAGRTHQRLAESETTDRHPPRPQPRHLPRLPPARDDPHPHQVILRSAPDPGCGESVTIDRQAWPLRFAPYGSLLGTATRRGKRAAGAGG